MSDGTSSRHPVKPGDIVGGKYRVDRVLGAGGMGVVVAAVHTELDQPVALKFILPEALAGKDALERFMREARAVARLKSEHVARVYDVGREGENPYMVLELLEGDDLATLNKRQGPFAVADAVEFVLQACEALVEAHTTGIVHRDLKPQNLFVTRRLNGTPLVKVLDFGIAKAVGAAAIGQLAITDSQAVIGSPLYMAPEHMRSARAADTRSDIWSLGVILYELLGGQLPFDGETVTEVCIRVVNEAPAPLQALRPALDSRLVAIAMRCLDKDPGRRWQNVAQLASALEPFARSTQHGSVVRPWRSLEDTADVPVGSLPLASSNPVVSSVGSVTPASAITPPVAAERKLASTDVTWGEGTDGLAAQLPRRSRFTTGLAVGALLAVGAAAAVAVALHSPPPKSMTASAPPPPATALPAPTSVAASASVLPAPESAPPVVTPATEPAPVASASAKPKAPFGRPPRGPSTPPTKPAAPASAAPAAPPDAPAPNGAPILR